KNTEMRTLRIVLILLVCSTLGSPGTVAQQDRIKLILDTDIGDDIDDAWALGFVISHPPFTPLGITITHETLPNARRLRVSCFTLPVTIPSRCSSDAKPTTKCSSNIRGPKILLPSNQTSSPPPTS